MQVHSDAVRRHLSIPRPTLPPCGVRGQREGSSTVQRRGKRSRRERGGVGGGLGVEWGGWVGGGRDRLKLSQGDDVDENVPLRKGAPKRSWRRDLESTKGFVLEADIQAGGRGVGWGRGIIQTEERHQAEKAREILYTSESDAFLSMCSLITPSRKSSQPASHPPSFRSFPVLYILNGE